jgi:formylglycine-generating enzyme required for sulfatase activity/energy-coupling factor transporter ATP-binding protein EcfA2
MDNEPSSGSIVAGGDIHAENVVTGIQHIQQHFSLIFQQPFKPPPDLGQLRADYLTYLHDSYHYLDMQGIQQVQHVTQQLALTDIYVPLKADAGHAAVARRVAGRPWFERGAAVPEAIAATALAHQAEPVPVEIALQTAPAVVVLGDPGSGKSTLLKVLALALAAQPDGPLPILLPLNAYARCLIQQGALSLSQFLGDYYASRQHKLERIGELFHQALAEHQAVILLDGLDEVQANRAHLVRLVQDFVGEHIPSPADPSGPATDRNGPPPVVAGNRVVATSRIVGYDEAPLAGRQWRTYTLIDFTRADIEQFVTQWTLAFTRSVQGDTDPARQAAARERGDLLQAIFHNPSVERLAANPLLLTILALIKHTGVTLPEQRVKLYELYLQTLIESWNRARSLDQYPVGGSMRYEETVQVLAPLALWLRQENPTAGLVTQDQLDQWLTDYYRGYEWKLPAAEARQRGRDFLDGVQRYSNLLLERGERQYGFLHLTLEEMLAAQGIVQRMDASQQAALGFLKRYLPDPAWQETLQLAIGFIAVIQRRPRVAGEILQGLLAGAVPANKTDQGRSAIFAGRALLDMGPTNLSRAAAQKIERALVQTMHAAACPIRTRHDAGDLLGRLGWTPDPQERDVLLAPAGCKPTGLDAFRPIPSVGVWMGKYPVTNHQFGRFIDAGGYDRREYWSETGWAWRKETSDRKAPTEFLDWLNDRPPDKRDRPYWWDDRQWNSPLFPVVGITWFEAEAYARWLSEQLRGASAGKDAHEPRQGLVMGRLMVRLPTEAERGAAIGGRGAYPWGARFDRARLNCAESWAGRRFSSETEWVDWIKSDAGSRREAGTTAVTTYPQGASQTGVCDGSGNVWEWMGNPYALDDNDMALRGGAWYSRRSSARVSSRDVDLPGNFSEDVGVRVVVGPVLT